MYHEPFRASSITNATSKLSPSPTADAASTWSPCPKEEPAEPSSQMSQLLRGSLSSHYASMDLAKSDRAPCAIEGVENANLSKGPMLHCLPFIATVLGSRLSWPRWPGLRYSERNPWIGQAAGLERCQTAQFRGLF